MAAFNFYLQSGNQREVRCAGEDSHALFGQKLCDEKGSVIQCVVMIQQPIFSQNFCAKSSHIFTHSLQNVTKVIEIKCLACQDEFVVNISLDIKENYEYALEFALHLSRFFGLSEFALSLYGSCFLPRKLV
jgi:hypothetical protein